MLISEIKDKLETLEGDELESFMQIDFKTTEDISGLEKNRNDLLGQNKKLRDRIKSSPDLDDEKKKMLDFLEKSSIIDAEDLESSLTSKSDDVKSSAELARLKKALEVHQSKASELTAALESERKGRMNDAVKIKLSQELGKVDFTTNEVREIFLERFLGKAQAELTEDGQLNVFDSTDGVTPISEAIASWSKTDNAKPFLKATVNSGGGAGSGQGQGSTPSTYEEIAKIPDQSQRLKAMEEAGL